MKDSGLFEDVYVWTAISGIFGAIGIVGWQLYNYLRFGDWYPISVITALRWCEIEWSFSPTGWLGLYKILDFVPLSVAVLFAGLILANILTKIDE